MVDRKVGAEVPGVVESGSRYEFIRRLCTFSEGRGLQHMFQHGHPAASVTTRARLREDGKQDVHEVLY